MRKRIRSSALALELGMTSTLMCSGVSATGFDGTAGLCGDRCGWLCGRVGLCRRAGPDL